MQRHSKYLVNERQRNSPAGRYTHTPHIFKHTHTVGMLIINGSYLFIQLDLAECLFGIVSSLPPINLYTENIKTTFLLKYS